MNESLREGQLMDIVEMVTSITFLSMEEVVVGIGTASLTPPF